jgi:hypothetical protein
MRLFAAFISIAFVLCSFMYTERAHADWRWKAPNYHLGTLKVACSSAECYHDAKARRRHRLEKRIYHYHLRKRKEWAKWTKMFIPDCTWFGESGRGPKYARVRYVTPNSAGSGAFGKYQFKPRTYFASGLYDDWSPLDQEIAARREFWKHGTRPWSNC